MYSARALQSGHGCIAKHIQQLEQKQALIFQLALDMIALCCGLRGTEVRYDDLQYACSAGKMLITECVVCSMANPLAEVAAVFAIVLQRDLWVSKQFTTACLSLAKAFFMSFPLAQEQLSILYRHFVPGSQIQRQQMMGRYTKIREPRHAQACCAAINALRTM